MNRKTIVLAAAWAASLIIAATTPALARTHTRARTHARSAPVYHLAAPAIVTYKIGNGTTFTCYASDRNTLYCQHGGTSGATFENYMKNRSVTTHNAITDTVTLTTPVDASMWSEDPRSTGVATIDLNGAFTCPPGSTITS